MSEGEKKLKYFTSFYFQSFKQQSSSLDFSFILILADELCFKKIPLNCSSKSIVRAFDFKRFV